MRNCLGFLAALLLAPTLAFGNAYFNSVYVVDTPCHVYHFDAASGSTETDDTTWAAGGCNTAQNGTYHGGFTLNVTGITGAQTDKAATLNGTTGYMDMSASSDFGPNTNSAAGWSIEFWFNPVSAANFAILFANTNADASKQFLWIAKTAAGAIRFHLHQSNCTSQMADATAGTYTASAYHYIVITTVGAGSSTLTSLKMYVDGTLVNTTSSFSGTVCGDSINSSFGANGGNNFYSGTLDEAAFYNVALSQTQVTNHYNAGITTPVTSAAFPFSVKLDEKFRPKRFGPDRPILSIAAPSFVIEALNKGINRGIYAP